MTLRLAACFVLAASFGSVFAQPAPDWMRGVVWSPSANDEEAVQSLQAMGAAGFQAVRVPSDIREVVLAEADRLGFSVYVDLSAADLPAARFRERAPALRQELGAVLRLAGRHRSVRHIGLANRSDTSDPRSCEVIAALAEMVREEGPSGMTVYYVTRFPATDRCTRHADILLVEAKDKDPLSVLSPIRERVSVSVGLASYGVGVEPGRRGGWKTIGSEAHQARTLENILDDFLSLAEPPAIAFYYRWRDRSAEELIFPRKTGSRYGLIAEGGEPRRAFEVARGILTGEQALFAIDAGEEQASNIGSVSGRERTLVLLSWLVLIGVGLMTAGVPHFRSLVRHYFTRKDLFREAVQRGSDLGGSATLACAVLLSIAFGVVVSTALLSLSFSDALPVLLTGVEVSVQRRFAPILERPLLMVLLLALGYAVWIVLSQLWLSIIRGRGRRARAIQTLSLVVWSRWVWILLMVLSLLVPTLPARVSIGFTLGLLLVGVLAEFRAGYRSVSDYAAVVRRPAPRLLALGFAFPAALFLALGIFLLVRFGPELIFLWNLATRA